MDTDNLDQAEQGERGGSALSRRRALAAAAKLGLGGAALAAAGRAGEHVALAAGHDAALPRRPYHFVFVNHGTSIPFFVPTQFGAIDACALHGCTHSWTGSQNRNVGEMMRAFDAAIAGRADGIAVSIIDRTAFDAPVAAALAKGIPVVAYNADAPAGSPNKRLAYIGQDLFLAGRKLGERIVKLLPGGGHIGLFIDTPHTLNVQPRIDGAIAAITAKKGTKITYEVVATGILPADKLARVESYHLDYPNASGLFAVDGGSTESIALLSKKYGLQRRAKPVATGGFDLRRGTISGIAGGDMGFTIDQQAYQQGFYPVEQLYLYKLSGALIAPSNIDTGVTFVTKANIKPYLRNSRFEGTSSTAL